jgi:hypothetical protein
MPRDILIPSKGAILNENPFSWKDVWAPSTSYGLNDLVTYQGRVYRATTAHTSGVSFDSSKWAITADRGYSEIGYSELATSLTNQTNTSYADIPGFSGFNVTVSSRPVMLEFYTPVLQIASASAIVSFRMCNADASVIYASIDVYTGVALSISQVSFKRRVNSPGTFFLKPQVKISTGAYGMQNAGYNQATFVRAIEV